MDTYLKIAIAVLVIAPFLRGVIGWIFDGIVMKQYNKGLAPKAPHNWILKEFYTTAYRQHVASSGHSAGRWASEDNDVASDDAISIPEQIKNFPRLVTEYKESYKEGVLANEIYRTKRKLKAQKKDAIAASAF